jgi:hypothetical protein
MLESSKPLAKYMFLVDLLNLTFDRELSRKRDSNVKFDPLGARTVGIYFKKVACGFPTFDTIAPRRLRHPAKRVQLAFAGGGPGSEGE